MKIYDDTGRGEDYEIIKILYEDDDAILAEIYDGSCNNPFKVLIDKKTKEVACNNEAIDFYLFEK